ncbi:MAG: sensor histidine kinase [Planctomycetota bacterium]
MSLRSRLVLWYTGVFAVSGALLVTALHGLTTHRMRREMHRETEGQWEEWRRLTLDQLEQLPELEREIRLEIETERQDRLVYRLWDAAEQRDCLVLADPGVKHLADLLAAATPVAAPPDALHTARIGVPGRRYPYLVLSGALDEGAHRHLILQAHLDLRHTYRREADQRRYLLMILAGVVLLAGAGGWFLASRSLKPIDDTVAELSRIQSRNLGERLRVGAAGDELDRLRAAINGMLDRIETAFSRLESFTADAAHELRSPIAALECRLEVALNKARDQADYQAALGDALEQTNALAALAENLLLLARMDAQDAGSANQPVPLGPLLADLIEPFAVLAEQQDVALDLAADRSVTVSGDPVLLRRLFGNLVDNALRYTPPGGRVTVTVAPADHGAKVTVADTGIGVPPEALEHIFDRFYRSDPSRSRDGGGAGLGLSIARRVAELHRGRVDLRSTPGKGTTATVWLPTPTERPLDQTSLSTANAFSAVIPRSRPGRSPPVC